MLGSHLDTVRDAGKYDGMLGVVAGIECVADLHARGVRLPFAIEVVGFADEEGVRFAATLLGSQAVAGHFDPALLDRTDADGIAMRDALMASGLDPARIRDAARRPDEILAYVELHIEQGPVLEAERLPVGVVTAISGGNRFNVEIAGQAGHAGTVPMGLRRDALAAAAECVVAVERIARGLPGVVGTVGRIEALPGAINVIPGRVRFTLDARAPGDELRQQAVAAMKDEFAAIAARRDVDRHRQPGLGGAHRRVRAGAAAAARRGDPRRGRARPPPAVGCRPRRHGAGRHRADRHAVRPLHRRHQPQPGRGGQRRRHRGCDAGPRAVRRRLRAAAASFGVIARPRVTRFAVAAGVGCRSAPSRFSTSAASIEVRVRSRGRVPAIPSETQSGSAGTRPRLRRRCPSDAARGGVPDPRRANRDRRAYCRQQRWRWHPTVVRAGRPLIPTGSRRDWRVPCPDYSA